MAPSPRRLMGPGQIGRVSFRCCARSPKVSGDAALVHLPELDGAAHAGDRGAADPDLAVLIEGDPHPAPAAQRGALAGHVRGGDPPGGEQPRRERGVQAARDRVLTRRPDQRGERADLERLRRAVGVRPGHADVHVDRARPDREDRIRAGQQDGHPARAVVRPLDVHDVGPGQVQRAGHVIGDRVLDRAAAPQRRGCEREARLGLPDRDQPGAAFLHGLPGPGRAAAGFQPGVAGAQGGMSGERQLRGGGEDPDPVVRLACPRRQHERRLRQVRPAREQLHLLIAQAVGAQHDGDGVTKVRSLGEDIHLTELMGHGPECRGPSRPGGRANSPAAGPMSLAASGQDGPWPPASRRLVSSGRLLRPMPATMAAPPVTCSGPTGLPKMTTPASAPTSGSRLRNAPAISADTRLCPNANSVNGSSVPAAASAATASTGPGPAGGPGVPSVTKVKASAPRAAPRNCTAVTATGSRPGSSRACATVNVAEMSSETRTSPSPDSVAPPPPAPVIRPTPPSDTTKPAQATGRATVWCHSAAMTATSTGTAPMSRAAWVTLVRVMPAFCTMTDPPYPIAPEASTLGLNAARRLGGLRPATASRIAAARPKRAAASQPGPSHGRASLDSGTVVPQSSPAAARAMTA